MNRKVNGQLTLVALIASVLGWVFLQFSYSYEVDVVMTGTMAVAQLSGFYLVLRDGTLIKSLYWITICGLFALFAIGAIFHLQHWPGAGAIHFVAIIGIASVYLVSFTFKRDFALLNVLKVLWVLSYCGQRLVSFYHQINHEQEHLWQSGNKVIFWLMVAYFSLLQYKKRKQVEVMVS